MSDRNNYDPIVKATRRGVAPKPSEMKCQQCGAPAEHRHHSDYRHPLRVIYLCPKCHGELHRNLRQGVQPQLPEYDFSADPRMKETRAPVSVMAGGRRRRLFRRQRGGHWFVRFSYQGKEMLRSTGTTIETVAKENAKKIIESQMNQKPSYPETARRALQLLEEFSEVIKLLVNGEQEAK